MAINFCSHEFGTMVTTSSVSADGYEVENLLGKAKTMWGQPKGFVAESFIKPPVDINLMFRFNIWIQKIIIDPKVGSQMSGGVDVFTASVPMINQRGNNHTIRPQDKEPTDCHEKPYLRSQSDMQSEKNDAVFASVGRAFSTDRNTISFCFVNHGYQAMYPQITSNLHSDESSSSSRPGEVKRLLRNSQFGALTNVSHVTLRINRVISGSVAIKSVQVLGQPSRNCSKQIIHWVLQEANCHNPLNNKVNHQRVTKKAEATWKSKESVGHEDKKNTNSVDEQDYPEEFIDPITKDMLVLPVLLPSGHTINSETLTKHSEAEAVWGRPPNDPFTGIPFSQNSKPLPNVKLKERIDQYILKGGANVSLGDRDVGRLSNKATNQAVPTAASLVRHPRSECISLNKEDDSVKTLRIPNFDESNINNIISTSGKTPTYPESKISKATSKRKFVQSSHHSMTKRRLNTKTKDEGELSVSASYTCTSPSSSSSTQAATICHEDMLSQSLDTALEQALSSVPSFSRKTNQQCGIGKDQDVTNSWSCSACGNTIATKEGYHVNGPLNMYKLPCAHMVCRSCLLLPEHKKTRKCSSCHRSFDASQVVKVHL